MAIAEGVANRLIAPARNKGVSQDNLLVLFVPDVSLFGSASSQVSGKTAVLLVYGFCATPWEMRLLGQHLAANGYCSLGVLLSGHVTTPESLSEMNRSDWIDSVEEGCRILDDNFDKVFAVGLSTGALLILKALQLIPFSVIGLLSPFLRLLHPLAKYSC